jgi:anti-sigma B factor antagonist/stage II sporulation protein AA (anti-sigma F factor antagonist)
MVGLNISTDEQNSKVVLRLDGRLDAATVVKLEEALNQHIENKHYKILLDFQKVDYLSSAAMRLLLSITKKLKNVGGKLALTHLHDDVMEIIKMAGFDAILSIHEKEKEALESLD